MSRTLVLLPVLCLSLALPLAGIGGPTGLNLIPTADVLDRRTFELEVGAETPESLFSDDTELCASALFGLTGRFEAGIETADVTGGCDLGLNMKYALVTETGHRPAVGVGLLDAADSSPFSDWYVALAKDVGDVRLHSGFVDDGAGRAMLGLEWPVTPRTLFMVDRVTGHGAYATAGLEYEFRPDLTAQLFYGRANTRAEDDIVGMCVVYHGAWK